MFYPARVTPAGRDVRTLPASRLTEARLEHLTLGLVCFGAETSVDPGALGAYHVNVPLCGGVESRCGRQEMTAVAGHAAVFTPGRSWLDTLRLLLSELDNPDGLVHRSGRHRDYLERLLIGGLVLAQQHDYQDKLREPRPPARPRTVKRVIDAVQAAPEKPWPLSAMARQADVSARRLQQGFREHLGMAPTSYLRTVRLDRAHRDLATGASSVSEVAYRWGFTNLGRFALAYRERFGSAPSQTSRRAR